MTDPRIEAAAWVMGSVSDLAPGGDWERLTHHQKTHFRRLAKAVLDAADAAAWRSMSDAPPAGTPVDLWVINCDGRGHRHTDAYFGPIPHTCGEYGQYCDSCPPAGDFWVDGIFGERIFGEIVGWQPLPAPPASIAELGGVDG